MHLKGVHHWSFLLLLVLFLVQGNSYRLRNGDSLESGPSGNSPGEQSAIVPTSKPLSKAEESKQAKESFFLHVGNFLLDESDKEDVERKIEEAAATDTYVPLSEDLYRRKYVIEKLFNNLVSGKADVLLNETIKNFKGSRTYINPSTAVLSKSGKDSGDDIFSGEDNQLGTDVGDVGDKKEAGTDLSLNQQVADSGEPVESSSSLEKSIHAGEDSPDEGQEALEKLLSILERFDDHPTRPGYVSWLWKYQFLVIIFFFVLIYLLEMLFEFYHHGKLSFHIRASTCLLLGGNFRDIGESWLPHKARFITCIFLHGHIFHLISNSGCLFTAYVYFAPVGANHKDVLYVYHWLFPIFMTTAIFGSLYSYHSTLRATGVSVGASGATLGVVAAFICFSVKTEGVPPERKMQLLFTAGFALVACVPWTSLFGSEKAAIDVGAHIGGTVMGIFLSLELIRWKHSSVLLMKIADCISLFYLGLVVIAFLEVFRQYLVDGQELVIRAYVKWLGLEGPEALQALEDACNDGPDGEHRRWTAPGKLRCEKLTDDVLYALARMETKLNEVSDAERFIKNAMKRYSADAGFTPGIGALAC